MAIANQPPVVSRILQPIEEFLGFDIEKCAEDEFDTCDSAEVLDLRDTIDHILATECQRMRFGDGFAVPVPYDNWTLEALSNQTSYAQSTLLHQQSIVPMGTISAEINLDGRSYKRTMAFEIEKTKRFVFWAKRHSSLIRSGAMLPFSHNHYETDEVSERGWKFAKQIDVEKLGLNPEDVAPVIDGIRGREKRDIILSSAMSLYCRLWCIRKWGGIPVMASSMTWNLWKALVDTHLVPELRRFKHSDTTSTLLRLDMPSLQTLPIQEIIALHRHSEGFATWRERFRIVLRNVQNRIERGESGREVLDEELWPLRDAVRAIERDLKSASLFKLIANAKQTLAVGATTLFCSYPIINSFGVDPGIEKDLLKLGPATMMAVLWALLFGQPQNNSSRAVVDIYNAVFS